MNGKLFAIVIMGLALAGCIGVQVPAPSAVEKGKAIFNDPKLGTTGGSCNTCHPNGGTIGGKVGDMPIPDLHGAAPTFPKFKSWANKTITLAEMNNACITMMLKGKPLDVQSQEMKDLEAYLHSLKGTPVTPAPAAAKPAPKAPGY